MLSHLYASLIEFGDAGQLLPVVDVRILVLPKGHFQLFQLLVAEGCAVASPSRGRIGPVAPAETSSHRGLTQRPLPSRLAYICFQDEERKKKEWRFYVIAKKDLHFFSSSCFWTSFCFPGCHDTKMWPEALRAHFTNECLKKEGLLWLYGFHCHQATWEPESFSCQTQAREKEIPETEGFDQDYLHNR